MDENWIYVIQNDPGKNWRAPQIVLDIGKRSHDLNQDSK